MKENYKGAFYALLRPVHLVIGLKPIAVEGSPAAIWEAYLNAVGSGNQYAIQWLMASMVQSGSVQSSEEDYNNLQGQREHWKNLANKIWLQYVIAAASSEGSDLSAADNVLLTTLPAVFVLRGI